MGTPVRSAHHAADEKWQLENLGRECSEQNWKNENVGLGPVDRAPLAAELHYSYAAMGAVAA